MPQDTTPIPSEDVPEVVVHADVEPVEHVAKDSASQHPVRFDSSGRVLHEWEVDPS